jgi:RNA polymerase sigma-70 factor (ECF subfamily)
VVGQFANAIEDGDIETVVTLLTDDALLTMPPYPYQYEGGAAIGNFLRVRGARHETPLRLVPSRANGQPAFGCYLPCPQTDIARAYGLMVLTLAGSNIAEITFFADSSVFRQFGLPRTVAKQRG